MKNLLINPLTAKQVSFFTEKPAHALLLVGNKGMGKFTLAHAISAQLLGCKAEQIKHHPYVNHIQPNSNGTISIDTIRHIEQFLLLKVPTNQESKTNRVIIIEAADSMTPEAQNALLKTLEAPPAKCVLILTAMNIKSLLPTISSRCQIIKVLTPDIAATEDYFEKTYARTQIKVAIAISGGLPGLTKTILETDNHIVFQAAEVARQLLSNPQFDRLNSINQLIKDKELASTTLAILQQMARLSLRNASGRAAVRWQAIYAQAYSTNLAIQQNSQPKLALIDFALNL